MRNFSNPREVKKIAISRGMLEWLGRVAIILVCALIIPLNSFAQQSLQLRHEFDHEEKIKDVALNPDGSVALTASGNRLRFWDTESGKLINAHLSVKGYRHPVASPDNTLFATASGYDEVRIFAAANGAWIAQVSLGRFFEWNGKKIPQSVNKLAFSADGNWLLAKTKKRIYLIDVSSLKNPSWFTRTWADLSSPEQIQASMTLLPVMAGELHGGFNDAIFTTDGKYVFAKSRGLKVWETATGKEIDHLDYLEYRFMHGPLSPDGILFAKCRSTSPISLLYSFDEPGSPIELPDQDPTADNGTNCAFSPSGRWLVVWHRTSGIDRRDVVFSVYDIDNVSLIYKYIDRGLKPKFIFAPDDTHFVVLDKDQTIRIFTFTKSDPIAVHKQQGQAKNDAIVATNYDATTVITAGHKKTNTARIWSVESK